MVPPPTADEWQTVACLIWANAARFVSPDVFEEDCLTTARESEGLTERERQLIRLIANAMRGTRPEIV